jgi:purine-binding chemotaxis protein CheW
MKQRKDNKEIEVKDIQTYLSFKLAEEVFAVSVHKVLSILELKPITKVPHAPEYMRGVINLRGNVLPIIDMRVKLGMEKVETTLNTCIIVLNVVIDNQEVMLGVLVDSVKDILQIDETTIEPSPTIGTYYKVEFLKGLWRDTSESFIMILNVDMIFSVEEILHLQGKADEADDVAEVTDEKDVSEVASQKK